MSWGRIQEILFEGMTSQQQRTVIFAVLTLFFIFHVAWACGHIPSMPGFALASDIEDVSLELREIDKSAREAVEAAREQSKKVEGLVLSLHVEILEERMMSLHILRCRAGNTETKQLYANRIQRNLSKYRELQGYHYQLPACEDL